MGCTGREWSAGRGPVTLWVLAALACITVAASDAEAARRRRRVGALELKASEAGATVLIDGKEHGTTPIKAVPLDAGTYDVKVRKLGYLEFSRKVTIRPNKTVRVVADLLPFSGVISVRSDVPGAKVLVDGVVIGEAPIQKEVKLGSRSIRVEAPGYPPWEKTITSAAGKLFELAADFQSAGGGSDLDLTPLPLVAPSAGGTDASAATASAESPAGGLDDLSLEMPPLEPAPGPAGEDDLLSLEALPAAPGDLELVAPTAPQLSLAELPPDPLAGPAVEEVTPWYLRWYTITGAAALVVAAVAIPSFAVALSGQAPEGTYYEGVTTMQPGHGNQPTVDIFIPAR